MEATGMQVDGKLTPPRWRADIGRLAGASVVAQALPVLVLPWLTRHYPVADIGHWLLFAAVASNLATVACGRYEFALVLPRHDAVARLALRACMALALAVSAAVAGLVALAAAAAALGWRTPGYVDLGAAWLWLAPAVALAGFTQALGLWLNRRGAYGAIGRARVLAAAALAVGQVALGLTALAPITALLAAQVGSVALGALWLARTAGWPRPWVAARQWPRLRALAHRHRQFPLVNAPHAFVNALQDTLVLALVMAWAGPVVAGTFGLMLRVVVAPVSLVAGAWSEVLLGRLAALQRDGKALAPAVARSARQLAAFGALLALGLVALGPLAFASLLGEPWRDAGLWAAWLAPYAAGRLLVGPLTVLPMVRRRQPTAFLFSLCGNGLFVGALVAGLLAAPHLPQLPGGAMAWACAAASVAMSAYFIVFGRWLWLLARQEAA